MKPVGHPDKCSNFLFCNELLTLGIYLLSSVQWKVLLKIEFKQSNIKYAQQYLVSSAAHHADISAEVTLSALSEYSTLSLLFS